MTHSARLAELHARYAASLASKHRDLDDAWRAFASSQNARTLRALQLAVHRLAGSAATYGYGALGALARTADALLVRETAPIPDAAALVQRLAGPLRALLDGLASAAADAAKPGA